MKENKFKMENLKALREKRNITQIKLSTEVEVSQELISRFEIGKNKPTVDNLIKLADYFNCSTDYLLQRTNIPTLVKNFDKQDIEIAEIINKYNSLDNKKKEQFRCFLDYLTDYRK